jgi:hypothetical protein
VGLLLGPLLFLGLEHGSGETAASSMWERLECHLVLGFGTHTRRDSPKLVNFKNDLSKFIEPTLRDPEEASKRRSALRAALFRLLVLVDFALIPPQFLSICVVLAKTVSSFFRHSFVAGSGSMH